MCYGSRAVRGNVISRIEQSQLALMSVPYCCMLDNRSLGPATDTEIKLAKDVLNAVANATWS